MRKSITAPAAKAPKISRVTNKPIIQFKKPPKPNDAIPGWATIRAAILDRDNYSCRICGAYDGEHPLHIHHVDSNRANNLGINLVTLCKDCHLSVHREHYYPGDHPDWPAPWGELEHI